MIVYLIACFFGFFLFAFPPPPLSISLSLSLAPSLLQKSSIRELYYRLYDRLEYFSTSFLFVSLAICVQPFFYILVGAPVALFFIHVSLSFYLHPVPVFAKIFNQILLRRAERSRLFVIISVAALLPAAYMAAGFIPRNRNSLKTFIAVEITFLNGASAILFVFHAR